MKISLRTLGMLAAMLLFPALVFAASDGSIGGSSTGSADISITIANRVRISGISDLNLGTFSGTGDMTKYDDVCIYTNVAGGQYHVTARGSATGGSFLLQSGAPTKTVPYLVRWNKQPGTTGNILLSPGVPLNQTGANTKSSTCSGANTANFQVTIPEKDLLDVEDGFYSGTLTFLVEPN